jgi:hypothetical protein
MTYFQCHCNDGWGGKTCEDQDTNECKAGTETCQNAKYKDLYIFLLNFVLLPNLSIIFKSTVIL